MAAQGLGGVGAFLRRVGQALDRAGVSMQGHNAYVEKLVPSTRVVAFKGKELDSGVQSFVAPTASVVGDVIVGEASSVWYGATVRGDSSSVKVGRNSAIQDNAVIASAPGKPVVIGDEVTIACGAYVSAATVEDGAMVGLGARVLPGATVGQEAYIDANAVVPEGTRVPPRELWSGNPATKLRELTADEAVYLRRSAHEYSELCQTHFEETSKSVEDMEKDLAEKDYREENYMEPDEPIPVMAEDVKQYYRLSADPEDQGLFREKILDDDDAKARLLAEEIAADLEEERYLNELASKERVYTTLKLLATVRPDRVSQREELIRELEALDENAAKQLRGLLERAHTASDEDVASQLTAEIRLMKPAIEVDRSADIAAALKAHAGSNKLSA